ncbi:MAG TPA: hypothetical protein VKB80_30465 [Kofleriaceae bacterium]|nr:hypothetical protein [Kofleriaceae bacterium]
MVRLARVASWVLCVLVAAGAVSAAAAGVKRRSAARCVRYSQKMDGGDSGADLRLDNRCRFAVTCSIQWAVRCAGHKSASESASLELGGGEAGSVHASAAACDGDWEVANVRWSCDPVRGP